MLTSKKPLSLSNLGAQVVSGGQPAFRKISFFASAILLIVILSAVPWKDRVVAVSQSSGLAPVPAVVPGVVTLLKRVDLELVTTYFLCQLVLALLLIARWHCFLRSSGMEAPRFRWLGVVWSRSQVIAALPVSQVGADVFRIVRLARIAGDWVRASGVIAAERLIGLVAIAFVGSVGLATLAPPRHRGLLVMGLSGVLVIVCISWAVIRSRLLATGNRPEHLTMQEGPVRRFMRTVVPLLTKPTCAATAFLLSLGAQVLSPLSFVVIDRALGFRTPCWCYLVSIPTMTLVQYLPFHVAGLGVLEGGLILLLGRLAGRTAAEVLALCATTRLLGFAWLVVLCVSFFAYRLEASPQPSHKK